MRGKAFAILEVTAQAVIIRPASTGEERPVPRGDFEEAHRIKQPGKALRPVDIRDAGAPDWHKSYVAAILNKV